MSWSENLGLVILKLGGCFVDIFVEILIVNITKTLTQIFLLEKCESFCNVMHNVRDF